MYLNRYNISIIVIYLHCMKKNRIACGMGNHLKDV